MAALLPAAAWLCAVALGSAALETDVRVGARGREVRLEGGSSRSTAELEVVPRLALLRQGRLVLSLAYAPRFTLPVDVSAGAPELTSAAEFRDNAEILHLADVAVEGAATRNLTLRLRGDGAYGRIDLLRSERYASEVLPTAGRIAWRSARATMDATATPTPRLALSGGVSAFATGGADETAREVVPLERGARLEAALRRAATRRDELSLSFDLAYSRFTRAGDEADADAAVVRVGGGWQRQLLRTLRGRLDAGGAWSYSSPAGLATSREVAPFAGIVLTDARTRPPVTTELAARVTPYMDPLAGRVHQRAEASASTTWRAARACEVAARATAAMSRSDLSHAAFWTGAREAEIASLELRATWAFAARGAVSIAPRARWQNSHDPALPSFSEWGAAVELTVGSRWPR